MKNSKGTEAALQQIAEDLKISTDNIVTNWVYSDSVQNQFEAETFVYKIGIGLILVCGFLIFIISWKFLLFLIANYTAG